MALRIEVTSFDWRGDKMVDEVFKVSWQGKTLGFVRDATPAPEPGAYSPSEVWFSKTVADVDKKHGGAISAVRALVPRDSVEADQLGRKTETIAKALAEARERAQREKPAPMLEGRIPPRLDIRTDLTGLSLVIKLADTSAKPKLPAGSFYRDYKLLYSVHVYEGERSLLIGYVLKEERLGVAWAGVVADFHTACGQSNAVHSIQWLLRMRYGVPRVGQHAMAGDIQKALEALPGVTHVPLGRWADQPASPTSELARRAVNASQRQRPRKEVLGDLTQDWPTAESRGLHVMSLLLEVALDIRELVHPLEVNDLPARQTACAHCGQTEGHKLDCSVPNPYVGLDPVRPPAGMDFPAWVDDLIERSEEASRVEQSQLLWETSHALQMARDILFPKVNEGPSPLKPVRRSDFQSLTEFLRSLSGQVGNRARKFDAKGQMQERQFLLEVTKALFDAAEELELK